MMTSLRRATASAAVALLALGLVACSSSDGDGPGEHDHSAHASASTEPAADPGNEHAAHGHDAMSKAHEKPGNDAGMEMASLKQIEPSADYPLKTCVVSGEALDAMDKPMAYEYGGQEVQFCCAGCVDEFKESPDKFVAKVKEAAKR